MKKKAANLLKVVLLILALCIPILQFGNGVDVQAATKLATPKLVSAKAQGTSGIKITWKKVVGADGYRIYRNEWIPDGWTAIKQVSNTSEYIDEKIYPGVLYYYTVKAYRKMPSGEKQWSDCEKYGVNTFATLPAPSLKIKKVNNKIELTWTDKYEQECTGYLIYRKTRNSSWKKIKTITSNEIHSYIDAPKSKEEYLYTIRSYFKWEGVTYKSLYNVNGVSSNSISPSSAAKLNFTATVLNMKSNTVYKTIDILIENKGSKVLRIYSKNARLLSNLGSNYNRDMYIVDYLFNKIPYIEIKPGKDEMVSFMITGSPTLYTTKSSVTYVFEYDNKLYIGYSSYYYGTHYLK